MNEIKIEKQMGESAFFFLAFFLILEWEKMRVFVRMFLLYQFFLRNIYYFIDFCLFYQIDICRNLGDVFNFCKM